MAFRPGDGDVTADANRVHVSAVFQAFGERLGTDGFALDAEDSCTLRFGEGLEVTMQVDVEDDGFVLSAALGVAPPSVELLETLLEANLFWSGTAGATLAMDPSSRSVFLHERSRASTLSADELQSMLERFVNSAEDWSERLSSGDDRAASTDGPPEAEARGRPVWG